MGLLMGRSMRAVWLSTLRRAVPSTVTAQRTVALNRPCSGRPPFRPCHKLAKRPPPDTQA